MFSGYALMQGLAFRRRQRGASDLLKQRFRQRLEVLRWNQPSTAANRKWYENLGT